MLKGTLEHSVPIILLYMLFIFLSLEISLRTSLIMLGIILIIIGILILKNNNFYNNYIKILFNTDNYSQYTNNDKYKKEKQKHSDANMYFLFGILVLIPLFSTNLLKSNEHSAYNIMFIYWITFFSIELINSLIGLYLYRKFKNEKQYEISFYILVILMALSDFVKYIVTQIFHS